MKEKITKKSWPRHLVKSIDCRKRDLVIRISDWTKDKDEPGFDVECYIKGIYDWNESKCFSSRSTGLCKSASKNSARMQAINFANQQIAKLL